MPSTRIIPTGQTSAAANDVCHLCHSRYELKQVPQEWSEKFSQTLFQFQFHQSDYDPSCFFDDLLQALHVEDIIVVSRNSDNIHQLQHTLHSSFHMKDLGTTYLPFGT